MLIQEIMTPEVKAVTAGTSVTEAATGMRDNAVGILPVVSEENKVVGMLTDRDIVLRVVAEGRDPKATEVGQIASKGAFFCRASDPVDEAAKVMEKNQVRRLLVVDDNDAPAGIVSLGDLASRSTETSPVAGEVLEEVSKPGAGTTA